MIPWETVTPEREACAKPAYKKYACMMNPKTPDRNTTRVNHKQRELNRVEKAKGNMNIKGPAASRELPRIYKDSPYFIKSGHKRATQDYRP